MYKYNVSLKSGTGGYFDEDDCDCLVKKITTPFLPRIGETISIMVPIKDNCKGYQNFLVQDIKYWYFDEAENGITVYVIPINTLVYVIK